uniref:Uncharacterized protein n=1 Tax=Oryza punctata TaxID=4537 RepID=A0A0E0LYA6_ORYPU
MQKIVEHSEAKSKTLKIFNNVTEIEEIRRAVQRVEFQRQKEAREWHYRERELYDRIYHLRRNVEDEQENSRRETAKWEKRLAHAEATGGQARIAKLTAQLEEAQKTTRKLQAQLEAAVESSTVEKKKISKYLEDKTTTLNNLHAKVDLRAEKNQLQFEHFERELEAAKTRHEELVESLALTLRLLFRSHQDGKDPIQLATELVLEGPTTVRRLS